MPPALVQPLQPLPSPRSSNCADLLNTYMDTLQVCGTWGAKYRALVEAVEVE